MRYQDNENQAQAKQIILNEYKMFITQYYNSIYNNKDYLIEYIKVSK